VTCKGLNPGDIFVLKKVFAGCGAEDVTIEEMEADFLEANPSYAGGAQERKEGAKPVESVFIPGLIATLPDGFAANPALQRAVQQHFRTCLAAIEAEFTQAGLGCLAHTQLNSILMGSVMQQYVSEKPFGAST
jgi:hypothetical protein